MKLSEANKKEMCAKYTECETCPFDSSFSALHWMQRGYFCKIDDFKHGLIEDMDVEEPPAEEENYFKEFEISEQDQLEASKKLDDIIN